MSDLSPTIVAKSDQLNADDLLGGPRTVRVIAVRLLAGDQPVAIHYEGDDGKPWKPCKSMRRVLVKLWGKDSAAYVGRRLTLFNDPTVKWGGAEVGGVRIGAMSDIGRREVPVSLTVTRGVKKPWVVQPLGADRDAGEPRPSAVPVQPDPPRRTLKQMLVGEAQKGRRTLAAAIDDVLRDHPEHGPRIAAWRSELERLADDAMGDDPDDVGDISWNQPSDMGAQG